MSATTEAGHDVRSEHGEAAAPHGMRHRSGVAVVAVLAAILGIGLGWMVGPADRDGVPADVREFERAWLEAWNAADGDAVLALSLPGGRHYCPATGAAGVSGDELVAFVEEGWRMTDPEVVSVARSTQPDGQPYSDEEYVVVIEFTLNGRPGYLSVLHLRGTDGALRFNEHHTYP